MPERRCHSLGCPDCIETRLGDWRRGFRVNLDAHPGTAVMGTITAPGADVLPWVNGRCLPGPLEEWCSTRDARLRRFLEAAHAAARRRTGQRANVLATVAEPQQRGAPHWHVACGTETPRATLAAQVFLNFLHDNHERYGFGFCDGWVKVKRFSEVGKLSWYIAGYLTPAEGGRKSMAANFRAPATPRRPMRLSRRLTSATGVTQRNLRRHRHVHCWARLGIAERPVWWGDVDRGFLSYLRALPLLDPELATLARAP